jgi:hypothetical protein
MEQVTPANADYLIDLLGEALADAVAHLDYCGWGDSWERQGKEAIEPGIRSALETWEKLREVPKIVDTVPTYACDRCGRVFKSKSARKSHKKHSTVCVSPKQ